MGFFHYDPDEYETIVASRPCSCGGKCDGRCNGMLSVGQRRRPQTDINRIKAERRQGGRGEAMSGKTGRKTFKGWAICDAKGHITAQALYRSYREAASICCAGEYVRAATLTISPPKPKGKP